MPEHDPLVFSYSHLRDFPREKEALHALQKVASLVKPLMRARGWVVRELAEFFPDQANLLGLNINHGQKILLRLRHPGDRTQFIPVEQVTDTMLHELAHIVHGPHDEQFHALWNQLRDEHEGLARKGYTGEGFLSEGHRLGGRGNIPMHEARRLARAAAEKRRAALSAGSGPGRRLGGAAARPGEDIRRVIASAAERRNRTLRGCGNAGVGGVGEREAHELAEQASRNGFRTQAEEDAANEAAIAQALWELVQEDERRRYGDAYVPPSALRPEGSAGRGGGGALISGSSSASSYPSSYSSPSSSSSPAVAGPSSAKPKTATVPEPLPTTGWTCPTCTLHNPIEFLCCDACEAERPVYFTQKVAAGSAKPSRTRPTTTTTARASFAKPVSTSQSAPTNAATWQCSYCGNMMERMWWTCSTCGKMKDNSR